MQTGSPSQRAIIHHEQISLFLQDNLCSLCGDGDMKRSIPLSLHIRRDLSGSGLLTIVCKRFLIRELEDRFESQSRASRSGIALGVSPSGVSPQVVDHRLESATIPRPIAIAKGAKQLREGVGGGH